MSSNTNTDILIAGAFAAFTVDLLVYPLDTLKTRIQSPDYKRLFVNESTNTVKRAALFRGLYQGLGSVIIATLPSSGAFFTTYEGTKSLLTKHNPSMSSTSTSPLLPKPLIHSTASALAELVSCAILTPAEVIKQNAQMITSPSPSPSHSKQSPNSTKPQQPPSTSATLQTLARFRHNPLALWRGYTALAGRNLPFTAMQFPMFERLKEYLLDRRQRRLRESGRGDVAESRMPLWESGGITAVAAGLAGSVAAVITTPIDVVKTRIMLAAAGDDNGKGDGHGQGKAAATADAKGETPPKHKGAWTVGREIVRDQGWKGLWRGGALRGVWTMLGSGLYLGVYESGRLYLEDGRAAAGRRADDD